MTTTMARVGDVSEQLRGVTYAKHEVLATPADGYVRLLRANNITDDGLTLDGTIFVPAARVSPKQYLRTGDVVIAASSGSIDVVGKAAPVVNGLAGTFGAFLKVLRPGTEVDASYFAHFFKTRDYRTRISELAAGVNINNLRNAHLDNLVIPLPPLPEQRRIAAILDQAEALRATRRQSLARLDALTQSIFIEMFGDPVTNPKGWQVAVMDDLIVDGPQNGLYKPASDYGQGTPILRIDAFYDGRVTDVRRLKRVTVTERERTLFALSEDDIVINRVNSPEYLGKSALVRALPEPTVFESNMMRFRIDPQRVHPEFMIAALQSKSIKEQIRRGSKDAVNQSSINQQDVKSFRILLPPLDLQRQYARCVASMDALGERMLGSSRSVDALFASLQHRAFRGEL